MGNAWGVPWDDFRYGVKNTGWCNNKKGEPGISSPSMTGCWNNQIVTHMSITVHRSFFIPPLENWRLIWQYRIPILFSSLLLTSHKLYEIWLNFKPLHQLQVNLISLGCHEWCRSFYQMGLSQRRLQRVFRPHRTTAWSMAGRFELLQATTR